MNEVTTRVIEADEVNFWGDRSVCDAIDEFDDRCSNEAVIEETYFVSGKKVVHVYCETDR